MASIGRTKLAAVIKAAGDVVRVTDAATSLGVSRTEAAKTLARWAKQGWLQRVGTGAYVPVGLAMTGSGQVVEDAWVLVPTLFGPAYIGGRSAAEYWDLTEQIFRDIVVFTARPIRARVRKSGGAEFTLRRIPEERISEPRPSGGARPRCWSRTLIARCWICSTIRPRGAGYSTLLIAWTVTSETARPAPRS